MSAVAIVVLAVVVIWLVGMLLSGILRSKEARATARHDDAVTHRSHAERSRTEAALKNQG
jgi:hypothetical protein